jgi:hypothetical protein
MSVLVFVTEPIDHRGMTGGFREDYMFERKTINHEIHDTHENKLIFV